MYNETCPQARLLTNWTKGMAAVAITTTQLELDRAATSRKWLIALAVMLGTSLEVLDVSNRPCNAI